MAKSTKQKKKRVLEIQVTKGPGKGTIQDLALDLMDFPQKSRVPLFGNGFRDYPVRFKKLTIYIDEASSKSLCDIEGVLDYTVHYPSYKGGGERVSITGYCPRTRQAKKAEIFMEK